MKEEGNSVGIHDFLVEEKMMSVQGESVYIVSEDFPLWLLALTPLVCDHVFFGGVGGVEDLGVSDDLMGLVLKAIGNIGWDHVSFIEHKIPPDNSVGLAYGSLSFLKNVFLTLPSRSYLLLSSAWRRRSFPKTDLKIKLNILSSVDFGSPVDFTVLIGVKGSLSIKSHTNLRRAVRHVLDYGVAPSVDGTTEKMISEDDHLKPSQIHQHVCFRSGFLKGKVGHRSFTLDELGVAFGLPKHLMTAELKDLLPCVPLQVLVELLEHTGETATQVRGLAPLSSIIIPPVPIKTWIPALGKYLPHTWCANEAAAVCAVKHDDAPAPEWLWNNRITMGLGDIPGSVLTFMRTRLHARMQRKLYFEFSSYMKSTHGAQWHLRLSQYRRQMGNLLVQRHERGGGSLFPP